MHLHDLKKDMQTVDKIWLKSYTPGVPAEINPDAFQSIPEILNETCQKYQQSPAFYCLGTTINYGELDQLSNHFAAYLQHELKLQKGDRIAIMLPNLLQYPIAMFGALKAGLVVVNVNPLYTADELTHQLNDAQCETLLVLANFADTVQKSLPNLPKLKNIIITYIGDYLSTLRAWVMHLALKYYYRKIPDWNIPQAVMMKDAMSKGSSHDMTKVVIHNTDIAFLQYTGGTTGVSKGAVLTHRNIIANLQQANAWFQDLLIPGKEIIITALPLYHIFSLTANCMLFVRVGGLNVLIPNPRDISALVKDMSRFKFTALTGVNTLFNALLKHPAFAALDFESMHLALGGGMAVQEAVALQWQRVTGKPLLEAYGLTETSPCVTMNPDNLKSYNGTIGLPVSSTLVAILDEDHKMLPIGETGELAVKGPQVMQGYWNNAAETAKVFSSDGWLLTGDMASMDEKGYVRILERKKDMILVSGFNVYPNEIEGVLAKIPGVRESAVIGVHDENSGEVPKAFIVADDKNLTAEEVIKFCRQHLTPYKIPKYVIFRDELPKSNVGKILRRALKDQ